MSQCRNIEQQLALPLPLQLSLLLVCATSARASIAPFQRIHVQHASVGIETDDAATVTASITWRLGYVTSTNIPVHHHRIELYRRNERVRLNECNAVQPALPTFNEFLNTDNGFVYNAVIRANASRAGSNRTTYVDSLFNFFVFKLQTPHHQCHTSVMVIHRGQIGSTVWCMNPGNESEVSLHCARLLIRAYEQVYGTLMEHTAARQTYDLLANSSADSTSQSNPSIQSATAITTSASIATTSSTIAPRRPMIEQQRENDDEEEGRRIERQWEIERREQARTREELQRRGYSKRIEEALRVQKEAAAAEEARRIKHQQEIERGERERLIEEMERREDRKRIEEERQRDATRRIEEARRLDAERRREQARLEHNSPTAEPPSSTTAAAVKAETSRGLLLEERRWLTQYHASLTTAAAVPTTTLAAIVNSAVPTATVPTTLAAIVDSAVPSVTVPTTLAAIVDSAAPSSTTAAVPATLLDSTALPPPSDMIINGSALATTPSREIVLLARNATIHIASAPPQQHATGLMSLVVSTVTAAILVTAISCLAGVYLYRRIQLWRRERRGRRIVRNFRENYSGGDDAAAAAGTKLLDETRANSDYEFVGDVKELPPLSTNIDTGIADDSLLYKTMKRVTSSAERSDTPAYGNHYANTTDIAGNPSDKSLLQPLQHHDDGGYVEPEIATTSTAVTAPVQRNVRFQYAPHYDYPQQPRRLSELTIWQEPAAAAATIPNVASAQLSERSF